MFYEFLDFDLSQLSQPGSVVVWDKDIFVLGK